MDTAAAAPAFVFNPTNNTFVPRVTSNSVSSASHACQSVSNPFQPASSRRYSGPSMLLGFFNKSKTESAAALSSDLVIRAAAAVIPHPDKVKTGGEDAHFVSDSAMGVFDGVSGWADIGIDPKEYANTLSEATQYLLKSESPRWIGKVIRDASKLVRCDGATTACVVGIDKNYMYGVNLGDSGVRLIRDGKIVFKSEEQSHAWNTPYQLGKKSQDTVEMGQFFEVKVRQGDILIGASDGLYDNLFEDDLADIVEKANHNAPDSTLDLQALADQLAQVANKNSLQQEKDSPFSIGAKKAGKEHIGGKPDDITVVVAQFVPKAKAKSASKL